MVSLQRYATAIHSKGYSVRLYVCAVVAAILIPALLLGAWIASISANAERAALERNAEQMARGITALIDHEIANTRGVLTALASSSYLGTGDLATFYRQASAVSHQLGIQIVLRDPYLDQQVVNTAVPWGGSVLRGPQAELRTAELQSLRPGELFVSNVFRGPLIKQYVVAVLVPVMQGGTLAYYLSAGITTKKFSEILSNTQIPALWYVTIVDRNDVVVARSHRHDEFTGTKLRNEFASTASPSGGVNTGVSREGILTHWIYRRSEASGWFISVAITESVLNAPMRRAFVNFGAAGGLLLVVALAMAYHWGGRLAQSFGALGVDRSPTNEEFRILFESAPNGVLVVDNNGLIVLLNARMEQKFGYSRAELVGRSLEMLVPERFRRGHSDLRKAFAQAPSTRPMGAGRELFGQRKDGSEFPIEIGLNPISTNSGNLIMATVVDISARKRAAERLAGAVAERDDLRRRFLQAQEAERLRLAHELHDQTGQSLAAVMLGLKRMDTRVDEAGRDDLRVLRGLLEQMGKSLHHVAWELRPASIDELGLATALANYISEWGAQFGIETDFHCGDARINDLTDEVRTTVYRVVQEALTNIAKHARNATMASVLIDRNDGTLQLTIEDNGTGFEEDAPSEPSDGRYRGGLGLAGMRERLSLIGGDLVIESSVEGGSSIFARIPLEKERLSA